MTSLHANSQRRRKLPLTVHWLRFSFRFQSLLSTAWAARRAYRVWFRTPRFNTPPREARWLATAQTIYLPHRYGPLALYQWGEGQQTVLLLHGWSGRGSQMGAFAEPLVKAGYRVIAMDAPGHGQSPGNRTTLFKISEALLAVANHYAPIKAVIAHSFGAFVLTYTLRYANLKIDKAVCISTPGRTEFLIDSFCDSLQLNHRVKQRFLAYFERDFGEDIWQRMSIQNNVGQLPQPALIIHDKHDREVPSELSEKLAAYWPAARLYLTEGLGHRRVLRNKEVIRTVVEFIA